MSRPDCGLHPRPGFSRPSSLACSSWIPRGFDPRGIEAGVKHGPVDQPASLPVNRPGFPRPLPPARSGPPLHPPRDRARQGFGLLCATGCLAVVTIPKHNRPGSRTLPRPPACETFILNIVSQPIFASKKRSTFSFFLSAIFFLYSSLELLLSLILNLGDISLPL